MKTHFMQKKEKKLDYHGIKNELIKRRAMLPDKRYTTWKNESVRPKPISSPRISKGCIDERNKPTDLIVDIVAGKRTINEVERLLKGNIRYK